MAVSEVFILSAVRTPIGSFAGALKDVPLVDLATTVVQEAIRRSGAHAEQVGHVVMGNVIPTEARDAYLSRVAALNAGIPVSTPAFNVNRLCGSGLQAILSAAQTLALGQAEIAIGAGAESMSRSPFILPALRWGARMGDTPARDYMLGILHDPLHDIHMGVTAENIAAQSGISRLEQDTLAAESHRRASLAIAEGRFQGQLAAVSVPSRHGPRDFLVDEHVRPDTTSEKLAGLKPAFVADGSVTAGNASGLADGASALVLASGKAILEHGLKPIARLVAYAHAGVEPTLMGLGPIPATRLALERAGLGIADMAVIECNEAFAAQACAVTRALDLDPAKVNPNGSGISLGHPVGATGAIISTKAIHELHRVAGRYALVTLCIGGGQGIAAIFERV
ncbi:acetyl-CoA C-acyltransferase family protein [Pseudomonas typographi]|uniref:acetyl-CoA C-acyltransferase family protein n=1 Tax=Pseudomonas typographi TaxID=2715964 RepID=UPI001682F46A|nr:acetyl-CoA C-acyltransferase family protein [Pseudomonas typographi]MBD1551524.1 acetyl-CoA C-acyltransferase family protein [Pseudomonas typographi]